MTTKPKAKKYRISRGSPTAGEHVAHPAQDSGVVQDQSQAAAPAAPATSVASSAPVKPETPAATSSEPMGMPAKKQRKPREKRLNPLEEIAEKPIEDGLPQSKKIQKTDSKSPSNAAGETAKKPDQISDGNEPTEGDENFTGRQLRMARRVAQKHGIAVESGLDAVQKLRAAGIDPFKRSNMLQLVSGESRAIANTPGANLPTLPADHTYSDVDRVRTLHQIQLDLARRRRRNLMMLCIRLIIFVFLPTCIAGYYYFNIATPMYGTKSEFLIQKADGGGGSGGGLGSLLAGSGLASSQDSITVQSYLTSRDAMLRLDRDVGYKSVFSQEWIDPVQRLPEEATNERAYKLYKKFVKIGYDPTEGIIKMEVTAPTPELSAKFSKILISYAEERVDHMTHRVRGDQMKGALSNYEKAENDMMEAEANVLNLQQEMGVFDASSDAAATMGQITAYEQNLQVKSLALGQLLDNPKPNKARVEGLQGDVRRLEELVVELRKKLINNTSDRGSLSEMSGRFRIAQTNLQTRTMLMQQALQQLESARVEANKQTRYLELGVNPVAPDEPTSPKAFQDTLLSFFIFAGIYLVASITGSVLREQVSS